MAKYNDKRREESPSDGFEEKVLYINRTSKVVKGGRKFSFSALILVGDCRGQVGYGFAKANEVSDAIRKGTEAARKNLIKVVLDEGTIPHEIVSKWDGSVLMMRPARPGTGLIAGSKVRSVLELAGVKDVVAKLIGSSTPVNQVRAIFEGLQRLSSREAYMNRRARQQVAS
ncbi:MAG: 30S ribosomal protein S5 [Chlamydiia bacterium]